MRIVIDLQGAQSASRHGGIGRYTIDFTKAILRHSRKHEIILVLSGLFPDTIEAVRDAFQGILSQENIRVWHAPGPVKECVPGNERRREEAEVLREAFLAAMHPDVILLSTLFQGYLDDAVTSIGLFDSSTPVSVIHYDLIPLLNPEQFLNPHPIYQRHYLRKVQFLKQANLIFAISDYSRQEAIDNLGTSGDAICSIGSAISDCFKPQQINSEAESRLRSKFGLARKIVLNTGGTEKHKNLPRLIEAYAALPAHLRNAHQLVLVGYVSESVKQLAKEAGLKNDELICTGYVSDDELIQLYNICQLYVFPSWHEGFGLPALEAMACGAAVIGANTSSLPQVIGLDDALFDPFNVIAINHKLAQALQDETFRQELRRHGPIQAKKFSWDETALRAISALEQLPDRVNPQSGYFKHTFEYDRLINALASRISHVDQTEIAELSLCLAHNQSASIQRQLFVDVSELCQRDAATGVQRVVRSYLKWLLQSPPDGFRVEPVYATREEAYRYARSFTSRFLGLNEIQGKDDPIRWQRGDIFFGLDMQHHVQLANSPFFQRLLREGVIVKFTIYDLLPIQLPDLFLDSNAKELHEDWLKMIASTDGAICISKATADALENWIAQCAIPRSVGFVTDWVHIGADIDGSQPSTGLPDNVETVLDIFRQRPTFLCVSTIEPRKQQQQIFEAFIQLWNRGNDLNLVFVGKQGWNIESLAKRFRNHSEYGKRFFWLEGISDEYLELVYAKCTCLIAASLNEGFGLSLIEAARHEIPILARDIPVFREVLGVHAEYFQGKSATVLADAVISWLRKHQAREHQSSTGLSWSTWEQSTDNLKAALVKRNYPSRQLLVDISELVQRDARTGIQRVVRNVLNEWLTNPPSDFRVEPIYATEVGGYRYARQFTQRFLATGKCDEADEPISCAPGDIFFGLDLQPQVQVAHRSFYQLLRSNGVQVKFMVHDLLPVLMPQYFLDGSAEAFALWLEVVSENNGAVCISKSTADDLTNWLTKNNPNYRVSVSFNHLGAEIIQSYQKKKILLPDEQSILERMVNCPTFLSVSTLEPRKGHAQVFNCFDLLWRRGFNVNLVIVGKQGWMAAELAAKLRSHPEHNNRLFWLEGISDEYLEEVYAASACLIAASYGEGFGLPLIEAARYKVPIIARDIPVFREVAGDYAFYFKAVDAEGLASEITQWLTLYRGEQHPRSDAMPWLTWSQSATQLLNMILRQGDRYDKSNLEIAQPENEAPAFHPISINPSSSIT